MVAARIGPALLGLLFASSPCIASPASFQVRVEVHDDKGKPFAGVTETLCREWYPKINLVLFGPDSPPPFRDIRVVFEKKIVLGKGALSNVVVPAYTRANVIRVNSAYVADLHESDPNDYAAMLVHELTHVVQHYSAEGVAPHWLTEGIADYVRHKYMEKDIEPSVRLDENGNPQDFELDRNIGDFETEGYKGGYTVAASFLFWLEVRRDKNIIHVLNRALRDGRYSDSLFQERCGATLQSLWRDFVRESRTARNQ